MYSPANIKPQEIINLRNEQFKQPEVPLSEGFHRANMTQCPLWNVVIIDIDIALQGLRQVLPGAKVVGRQDLAASVIEGRNKG